MSVSADELLLCCDADAVMKTEETIYVCVQKMAETARAQLEEVVCAVVHIEATSEKLLFTKNSSCETSVRDMQVCLGGKKGTWMSDELTHLLMMML